MDIPGVGDTAFPAVWRTGPHSFVMANYTSPLDEPDVTLAGGSKQPQRNANLSDGYRVRRPVALKRRHQLFGEY